MSIKNFPFIPFTNMSVRAKLRLSAAVTISLALIVALTVSLQYRNMVRAERTERLAYGVIKDVSDLNALSYAYLLLKDKRPKVQWQLKHRSLGKLLSEHLAETPYEQAIIARLLSNHERMKNLFDVVVKHAEQSRPGGRNGPSPYDELNEGVAAQLMARSESMVNDASSLGRESGRLIDAARRRSFLVIIASSLLLVVSAALTTSLLARNIGSSISAMDRGTQRIAAGDLRYRLDVTSKDEMGRLAAAFNDMTSRLATSYDGLRELNQTLEQRVAERTAELAASEQRLRRFYESGMLGVMYWNTDGAIIDANDKFLEMVGYTREELDAGKIDWINMTPAEYRHLDDQSVMELRAKGVNEAPLEKQYIRKDGTRIPIIIAGAMLDEARFNGVAFVIDITDRKRAEMALRKARDELELRVQERTAELQKAYAKLEQEMAERRQMEDQLRQMHKMEALGTLTGGIAHDFNNILAAILGFAEMSLDDAPQGTLLEKNLRNILTSSFRARDLIRQMLTFSRKTEYEIKPLSLTPIIEETAKLLRASIPTTIEINVNSTATSDIILANATGIQQVIINLCTNASCAMRDKGGKLSITLSDAGPYVQLTVHDTGVGMDAEVQKRIFEPFFTTKELGKGTGMGLAVVYGIVKSLRGDITVESKLGSGSAFNVLFPKAEMGDLSGAVKPKAIQGGKEHILFIDDEEMLVDLGQEMLERLGYNVTALTSSAEALRLFSENPSRFELIITDQTMPDLTGLRLASELLKLRSDIPIILCTGHSDSVNPETAKAAGIKEFLMKPLARDELAAAARRALDSGVPGG